METQLRALLYQQLRECKVAYNPIEPEPFDLVDLTRDITNSTRIYHKRTACVREALEGASLIVTDSQALAYAVALALPKTIVTALPFGPFTVADVTPNPAPVVGLLNHTGEMEHNNHYALKLLKSLKRELLVYGEALHGIEGEVIAKENFGAFAAKCDILLMPSMPGVINSTTLPLTLMAGNTAILAHNAPGYYELSAATGVQFLPNDAKTWRERLAALESQPAKLKAMHERNKAFAQRLNRESYSRLALFADQFVRAPAPLTERCGCAKKGKTAPIQPTKDQLISAKES
jgi:glycosyltransferase involved in cell wall biosynthesis